ncbi:them6 [Acrasis kona]|uniref:Acyl-CoA thioesterase n=1 Tax=Acrasis kona TaxID=1008807 RepID=A0AAW2Z0B2_9EUKA
MLRRPKRIFQLATKQQIENGIVTPPHLCSMRVMPWDIDYNLHLNNASYLTMLEYARTEWALDSGTLGESFKRGYTMGLAGIAIQYRREVGCFQRILIETRYVANDDKFFYVEQIIRKANGQFVSRAMTRIYMINTKAKKILHPVVFLREVCGYGEDAEFVFDYCKGVLKDDLPSRLFCELQDAIGEKTLMPQTV